jgi:short-subunit dehydrogenase
MANFFLCGGCRDPSQGEALMTKLRASGVSTGSVDFLPLDLASFESVRTFASNLIAMKLQINILINNGNK